MPKQRQIIALVRVCNGAAEYCEAMREVDRDSIPYVWKWLVNFELNKNKGVMDIIEQINSCTNNSDWEHVVKLWLRLVAAVAVTDCVAYKED
jgi:hypothetical protein